MPTNLAEHRGISGFRLSDVQAIPAYILPYLPLRWPCVLEACARQLSLFLNAIAEQDAWQNCRERTSSKHEPVATKNPVAPDRTQVFECQRGADEQGLQSTLRTTRTRLDN
jgi:hypothetical protein